MLKSGVNFILLFDMATYTWIKLEMNEVGVGKAKGSGEGRGINYAKIV